MALVEIPEPFDFELSTARFRAFGLDLATVWEDGALYRAVGGREVRVVAAEDGVEVEPFDVEIEAVVRKVLGSDFDLVAFSAWAAGDETLAPLVVRFAGFRPTLAADPFEMLVGAITAQQVSLIAALAIRNRFVVRFGDQVGQRLDVSGARANRGGVGGGALLARLLPAQGRVRDRARALRSRPRRRSALLPDDEVKARLTVLRGLGEWTADWFLARYLGRARAWPAGDLALRKAVRALYGDVDVRAAGERFEPFQNLTAHYLLAQFLIP